MLTTDALRNAGANVDEGLHRCMDNESFYLRMVGMALTDGGYEALGKALESGDLQAAFEQAHKLKGALGNLSLTPLYQPTSEWTELLRNKTPGDYQALYQEILRQKEIFADL